MTPVFLAVGLMAVMPALPPATIQALQGALQDERKAEALYKSVLKRHGDLRPFSNIVQAEGRHQDALVCLFKTHSLAVPANPYEAKPIDAPATFQAAVQHSIKAEEANIALYDGWLEPALAWEFLAFLESAEAQPIFAKWGWMTGSTPTLPHKTARPLGK